MKEHNSPGIIRSRFKPFPISFVVPILLFSLVGITVFFVRGLTNFKIDALWVYILMGFCLVTGIHVLNLIRYVVIDKAQSKMTYWSLLNPLGRRFDLAKYNGKYATRESSRWDFYFGVAHIVDGRCIRRVIYGTCYKNFDELYDAIPLPEINKGITPWQYLALATIGRIRVPHRWNGKKRKKK